MKTFRLNRSSLAAELNVNRSTVYDYLKRKGAPRPDKQGCFDVSEVRQFIQRQKDSREPNELLSLRITKLTAEIELLRAKIQQGSLDDGQAIPVEKLEPYFNEFARMMVFSVQAAKHSIAGTIGAALPEQQAVNLIKMLLPHLFKIISDLGAWCEQHLIEIDLEGVTTSLPWPLGIMKFFYHSAEKRPDVSGTMPKAQHFDEMQRHAVIVRTVFNAMQTGLAAVCVGKTESEIRNQITLAARNALKALEQEFAETAEQ